MFGIVKELSHLITFADIPFLYDLNPEKDHS